MRRAWTPGTEGGKGLSCTVGNPHCMTDLTQRFICYSKSPQLYLSCTRGDRDGLDRGFTSTCHFSAEWSRHLFLVHISIMSNLVFLPSVTNMIAQALPSARKARIGVFCAGQFGEWVKFVTRFTQNALKHISYVKKDQHHLVRVIYAVGRGN